MKTSILVLSVMGLVYSKLSFGGQAHYLYIPLGQPGTPSGNEWLLRVPSDQFGKIPDVELPDPEAVPGEEEKLAPVRARIRVHRLHEGEVELPDPSDVHKIVPDIELPEPPSLRKTHQLNLPAANRHPTAERRVGE